jgi:hypothetical protein
MVIFVDCYSFAMKTLNRSSAWTVWPPRVQVCTVALPPNRQIFKSHATNQLGLKEVAAVEDDRGFQFGFEVLKVRAAELFTCPY